MGVSIEDVRCQLLSNSHSCKTSNSVLPNLLNSSPASNRGRLDMTETEKEDSPEVLREEDVGTVDIKAIHFQLRRLLKDSNFSDGIVLTAIPEQKSKVMFTFENDVTKLFSPVSAKSGSRVKRSSSARTEKDKDGRRPSFARHVSHDPPRNQDDRTSLRNVETDDNPFDAAPKPKLLRQRSINKESQEDVPYKKSKDRLHSHKHSIGYIMFECGLEDIRITAVRRLGYKDKNTPDITYHPDNLETSVNETQMKTKSEFEGSSSSRSSKGKSQGDKGNESSTKGQGQKPAGQTSSPVSQSKSAAQSSKGNLQVGLDPLGVGKVEMYTSSNSVHSWDSRISIPSDSGDLADTAMLEGDASSGVLHLKTIWFNFAAPPPLPIKRKVDFTK